MFRQKAIVVLGLALASGVAAEIEEIGPWTVESYGDDFSFSALGSMITVERGFDRAAGIQPHILIVGCDRDPEKKFEITAWIVRDGYFDLDSGEEPEVVVHASFDGAPAMEQRWMIYNRGPGIGGAAPYEVNDSWFEALAGASSLELTFKGDPSTGVNDRVVEFDTSDFSAAFDALVCGTDEDD